MVVGAVIAGGYVEVATGAQAVKSRVRKSKIFFMPWYLAA
jgi:hypothetical protein